MSLSPGTCLGHYDVTALIGEGGAWDRCGRRLTPSSTARCAVRAVGLLVAVRRSAFTYESSLFARAFFLQIAVLGEPDPERGPHHLTLWQILPVHRLA